MKTRPYLLPHAGVNGKNASRVNTLQQLVEEVRVASNAVALLSAVVSINLINGSRLKLHRMTFRVRKALTAIDFYDYFLVCCLLTRDFNARVKLTSG